MRLLMCLMIIMSLTVRLFANDSIYIVNPVFQSVVMTNNDQVRMLWEHVVYKDGRFSTVFSFSNTSELTQVLTVGFPVDGNYDEWGMPDVEWEYEYEEWSDAEILTDRSNKMTNLNFQSFINGKEIERDVIILPVEDEIDFVFYTDVEFLPFEHKMVSNVYSQSTLKKEGANSGRIHEINYILETGAAWKDTISNSLIDIYLKPPKYGEEGLENIVVYYFDSYFPHEVTEWFIESYPLGYTIEKSENYSVIHYNFSDLEPTNNIKVNFGFDYTSGIPLPGTLYEVITNNESVSYLEMFYENFPDKVSLFTKTFARCNIEKVR